MSSKQQHLIKTSFTILKIIIPEDFIDLEIINDLILYEFENDLLLITIDIINNGNIDISDVEININISDAFSGEILNSELFVTGNILAKIPCEIHAEFPNPYRGIKIEIKIDPNKEINDIDRTNNNAIIDIDNILNLHLDTIEENGFDYDIYAKVENDYHAKQAQELYNNKNYEFVKHLKKLEIYKENNPEKDPNILSNILYKLVNEFPDNIFFYKGNVGTEVVLHQSQLRLFMDEIVIAADIGDLLVDKFFGLFDEKQYHKR